LINYSLEELIDVRKFQEMLDSLNEVFSLTTALLDKESKVLIASGWQDVCTKYHRVNPVIKEKCWESDGYIFKCLNEGNSTVTYKCPMGLVDSATPVVIDGKHVGNFFIGQFFLEEPDLDCFRNQAEEYGFDKEDYLSAVAKVPIFTPDQLSRNLAFVRNLTEFIAEAGLERLKIIESEHRFQAIFDSVNDAIFLLDAETGEIVGVNAAMTDMFGFTRDEARQISVGTISSGVAPFTDEEALGHLRGTVEGDQQIFEWHARRKDGVLFWSEMSMRKAHIASRELVVATVRDISERKRVEEELRTSEYRWKFALEGSGQGVWDWNLLSGEVQYSKLYREMLGYSEAEFPNRLEEWEKRVHPKDKASALEEHRLHFENETPAYVTEHRLRCKDGTWKWVLSRGMVFSRDAEGKPLRMIGTHTDITERKSAEETIRRLNADLSATLQAIPDPLYEVDRNGTYLNVWAQNPDLLAQKNELLLGRTVAEVLAPDAAEIALSVIREADAKGYSYGKVISIDFPDGTRWFEQSVSKKAGTDGPDASFIVLARDITERRRMEDALAAREQEFRAMIENAPDPIFRYDRECNRIYVNPATEQLSGMPASSMLGSTPGDVKLLPDSEAAKIIRCIRQVLETGLTTENEVEFVAENGAKRYFLNRFAPECGKDGNAASVLLISRDITALKQIEKELQDKNSELERFAYTVSHDLKSPLITIKSFSGSIKSDLASGRYDRIEKDLNRISVAADKMADLLDDLLKLSRVGHVINTPEPVDMAKLVHDVLKNMAGTFKENHVQVSVQPGLPTVSCDRRRIMEVVQNLLENAVKYRGNQLVPCILVGLREEAGRQVFFVQDNGPGIDPKFHENIFGLFNRLNTQVPGTGIGLALVKRIIEVHGGSIWVESDGLGTGSTFCFTVRG